MNSLLKNARWMDGFVWFAVCGFGWLAYETLYLGVPITAGLLAGIFVTWGLAGVGFALMTGYFSVRSEELKRQRAMETETEANTPARPGPDRAARRRAERETEKR